jgi:hypothetical protein
MKITKLDDYISQQPKEDQERLNDFIAKFGFGPNYKDTPRPTKECPKCHKNNAYTREIGSDTDYNSMEFYCPDCKYSKEI